MKRAAPVLLFLLLSVIKTNSQVCEFNNGKASFFSEAPIENIDAHSAALASALNTATNEIVFVVPVNSFQFKKALMQEHFNEKYMESDKYPQATYKGKINEKIDWTKDGTYKITSTGAFTVHGVSRERTDTAQAIISQGKIAIEGAFWVKLADHHITIPKLLFKNIAEVINVKFSGEYLPVKKVIQ
jgi:hypothetical protein